MFGLKLKSLPLILLLVLLIGGQKDLNAQISDYKGHSLFIYNFTKHIKWPSSPPTYTIGVFGNPEFYEELNKSLKGKQIDGIFFEVKTITSLPETEKCQIVYLSNHKSSDLHSLISSIGNKEILVITESDLIEKGAGISFLMMENKIRFKINQTALSKQGLQVSTALLSLAIK